MIKPLRNSWYVYISRMLFAVLILFELLVLVRVIPISPAFTTSGLLITAIAACIGVEYTYALFGRKNTSISFPGWIMLLIPVTVYLDTLGDFLHFYTLLTHYDSFLHFFNPAVICLWTWEIVRTVYPNVSKRFLLFTSVVFTIAVSALYEVEEYLEDQLTGSHRFGDAFDTGLDLTMDICGAVLCGCIILLFIRKRRQKN